MAPVYTLVILLQYIFIYSFIFQGDLSIDFRPVHEALQLLPLWLVSVLNSMWSEGYVVA